jgi:hypothetical protein
LQPKEIKFGQHFLKIRLFTEEGAKALYGRDLRPPALERTGVRCLSLSAAS